MERDKMQQNEHQQLVLKQSVSGDTAQKQQPVQKQSVSSDTAQKQNLQSVQNVDVFLSNLAKVKRSSSSLVSCRKFQTGQDRPGRHQVGDNTKHLVTLIDHKMTQLSERVSIIQKEKFVLHDEMAKVKSDLKKFRENKEKLLFLLILFLLLSPGPLVST